MQSAKIINDPVFGFIRVPRGLRGHGGGAEGVSGADGRIFGRRGVQFHAPRALRAVCPRVRPAAVFDR